MNICIVGIHATGAFDKNIAVAVNEKKKSWIEENMFNVPVKVVVNYKIVMHDGRFADNWGNAKWGQVLRASSRDNLSTDGNQLWRFSNISNQLWQLIQST